MMMKTLLAGTTALVIAGASLAYAQKGPDGPNRAERWRPNAQDMVAFSDARIAALKAGLKLTPEQEKNWPAVETAMRDNAKQRSDRFAARASADKPRDMDPIERMNMRADMMTQQGESMKKLAAAAGPLYQSLDESQKKRFMVLARLGGERHGWQRGGGHHGQDRMHHRGQRGPMMGPDGGPKGPMMGPDGGPRPQ